MQFLSPHRWRLSPAQARALQIKLRERVLRSDCVGAVRCVAGIDVGFEDNGATARAAVAVLTFPALTLVDCALARERTCFPYIPGLLSFREIPVVLKALRKLRIRPDVILCDGHGYAHPRRFGLACHLGLITEIPSIGVAKSLLTGTHAPVPNQRGAWRALVSGNETIGAALRSRIGVQPIFISIGHKVDLARAIELVSACLTRYRLPETTRWAHRLASSPAIESERIIRTQRSLLRTRATL
jgi:deoxyribonuclease V